MTTATRISFVVSLLALIGLVGSIIWAAKQQSLGEGLDQLIAGPWGVVTLIDLYAGFLFAGAWLVVTEPRRWLLAIWLIMLLGLGNVAILVCLAQRSRTAKSFREIFIPT